MNLGRTGPAGLSLLLIVLLLPIAAACSEKAPDPRIGAGESTAKQYGLGPPPSSTSSSGQRFGVPEVDTLLDVQKDGSLILGEKLNFRFDEGVFNNAFREIPHEGYDKMTKAEVYDSNLTLLARGAEYKADWCRGSYVVQWFFNETKAPANQSFYVFYVFSNALVAPGAYQSGVDWWVLGKDWPHFTEDVSASIHIPGNVTGSPLFAFRPTNGTQVEVRDGDTYVHFRARNVSAGEGFRVTAYFPRIIPLEIALERSLRENWLASILIFGVLLSLPAVIRTGMKETRRWFARPTSAGPDALSPALVSHLLRNRSRSLHYALATAEIARRGHLIVRKDPEQGSATMSLAAEEPPGDLVRHERVVFEEGAERGSVREIAAHWPAVGRRFRVALTEDAVERSHFTRSPRAVGYLPLLITGIVLIAVAGVLMWALGRYEPYWGIVFCGLLLGIAAAGVVTILVGGLLGSYRTSVGDTLAGEWGRKVKELRGRADLAPQERLWVMAAAGSIRAASGVDEKRERDADDPTPRMKWFAALE